MLLKNIICTDEYIIIESKIAYARKGNKIIKKFVCSSGPRKGKKVKSPGDCFKRKDLKKRFTLARTKAKKGKLMTRKSNRTKKFNSRAKITQQLNRKKGR